MLRLISLKMWYLYLKEIVFNSEWVCQSCVKLLILRQMWVKWLHVLCTEKTASWHWSWAFECVMCVIVSVLVENEILICWKMLSVLSLSALCTFHRCLLMSHDLILCRACIFSEFCQVNDCRLLYHDFLHSICIWWAFLHALSVCLYC